MKLYTEEQVRKILKSTHIHTDNDVDMILPQFTPIELPSDDEMGVISLEIISDLNPKLIENEEAFYIAGFVECAKWMRNKIQGGNNEDI